MNEKTRPICHVVAGPNGSGKSTFALRYLPEYTVDEALRTRPDYEMRKKDVGEWRRNNLIAQFKAAGLELTPDVWERLAADRRQALEDDLAN